MFLSNIFYISFCYAANSNAASSQSNSISSTNPSQANLESESDKTSTSNPNWLHASGWKLFDSKNDKDEFIRSIDPDIALETAAILLEAGEKMLKELETKIIPKLQIFKNSQNVEVFKKIISKVSDVKNLSNVLLKEESKDFTSFPILAVKMVPILEHCQEFDFPEDLSEALKKA